MAELKVKIGADIEKMQLALLKAGHSVYELSDLINTNVSKVDKSFTLLNQTKFTFGENYARASSKLATEAAKSAAVLGGSIKTGANQAAFALTNLGRVAQDAPFGFIGIQNNLNPLLESFQRLKAETGSTGGALKALTGSLMGPAGIGIALSVVSAGILLYQQYQQKAKKATDEGSDANKTFASSTEVVAKALESTDYTKAVKNVNELKINIDLAKRGLIDKQGVLKQYNETIGKTTGEVSNLNEAEQQLTKNGNAFIQVTLLKASAQLALEDAAKKSYQAAQKLNQSDEDALGGVNSYLLSSPKAADIRKRAAERRKKESAEELNDEADTLLNIAKEFQSDAAKLSTQFDFKFFEPEKSKATAKAIKDLVEEIEPLKQLGSVGIGEVFKNEAIAVQDASVLIGDAIERIQSQYAANQYAETVKQLDEQNKILADSFAEGFGNIGDSIGGALANGTNLLEAFGSSVLSTIGGVLQQFGKMAIVAGVASTALGAALRNPLNPGAGAAAIAAGIALVAVGAAVKGFGANLGSGGGGNSSGGGDSQYNVPGFANGVTNFRGGVALVGERGPELVNLPTGSDVIPNHQMSSFMGGGSQVIIPEVVIKGQDLKIVFNRANRDRG